MGDFDGLATQDVSVAFVCCAEVLVSATFEAKSRLICTTAGARQVYFQQPTQAVTTMGNGGLNLGSCARCKDFTFPLRMGEEGRLQIREASASETTCHECSQTFCVHCRVYCDPGKVVVCKGCASKHDDLLDAHKLFIFNGEYEEWKPIKVLVPQPLPPSPIAGRLCFECPVEVQVKVVLAVNHKTEAVVRRSGGKAHSDDAENKFDSRGRRRRTCVFDAMCSPGTSVVVKWFVYEDAPVSEDSDSPLPNVVKVFVNGKEVADRSDVKAGEELEVILV